MPLVAHLWGSGALFGGSGVLSSICCCMWIEFVGSLFCSESFFSRVLRFSPLTENQHLNLFCYDLIWFVHDITSCSALDIKVIIIFLYFSEEYCYWIGGGCRALGPSSQRRLLFLLVITWRFQCSCLVGSGLQVHMVAILLTSSKYTKYMCLRLSSVLADQTGKF